LKGRIGLNELLAVTGRTQDELSYLHRRGLFPFTSKRAYYQRGSSTSYDAGAVPFLNDLAEIEQQGRKPDEWKKWHLWIRGHPGIDVRDWALGWLSSVRDQALIAEKQPRAEASAALDKVVGGRMRNRRRLREAKEFLAAWVVDADRPDIGLALPDGLAGSYFTLALEVLGVPDSLSFAPVKEIARRGLPYWLDYLHRALDAATPEEMEQARHDWRLIADLVAMTEHVDWNTAPQLRPIGARPEPKSWADRKARRKRPRSPPDDLRRLLRMYRDCRAMLLPILIVARRVFTLLSAPRVPDEMLGIAQQWLLSLPRLPAKPSSKAAAEISNPPKSPRRVSDRPRRANNHRVG
jgi:hypothetical protein